MLGGMFYFTYNYASMSFLASYNSPFLVYVSILALSLYSLIAELLRAKNSFSAGPGTSRITATYLAITGFMLAAMWCITWLFYLESELVKGEGT